MRQTIEWNYGDALIDTQTLKPFLDHLEACNQTLTPTIEEGYHSPYGFLALPYDHALLQQIEKVVHQKKEHGFDALVIIGIGGSNLGTQAIHHALKGVFYNEIESTPCYYFDTFEDCYTHQLLIILETLLQKGKNLLITIVSKSGTTLETISNAALCISLLQKYRPTTFSEHVVIITDHNSSLALQAQKYNMTLLTIPHNVGGRFSVLSAVGLFPLAFLGFDIQAIQRGARAVLDNLPQNIYAKNAAYMAALLFYYMQQGKNIFDTFVFGPSLTALGLWYRQLMGESLGKKGKGMTPTISVGTTDLHSVLQLYLGGPKDKVTLFLTTSYKETIMIPSSFFSEEKSFSIAQLQQGVIKGVQDSYKQAQHPFVSYHVPYLDEEVVGTFMYMRMLEIIYLSFLMEVNPFDQPEIELYKQKTQHYLQ